MGQALTEKSPARGEAFSRSIERRSAQLRFVPRHELVEAAELSVLGFVLIQELQVRFVEFLEEFVPADLFQAFFLWAEIDAENAGVPALSSFFDGGGRPPTLIDHFLIFLWSVVV